jgi:hypothetical protein
MAEKDLTEDLPEAPEFDDLEPEVPDADDVIVDEPVDEGVDVDEEEPQSAAPSKETGRLARVTRERKDALERARLSDERAKLLELQMQQLQQMQYRAPPVDENLDPDEKWRRDANAAIQRSQFQTMDMVDKNSYAVKAITSPVYKRWENRVESELAKARQQGANPSRENILKYLLGESALGKIKTPSPAKTPARTQAGKVTVPGGRSTVSHGKTAPSVKERLMGVKL